MPLLALKKQWAWLSNQCHKVSYVTLCQRFSIMFFLLLQISFGSTTGVMSDKTCFPTFKRTVPDDDHQAQAITKLLRYHNWTWIGIITTDGDNRRYATDWLEVHASSKQIFVSYRVVLLDFLNNESLDCKLNEAIKQIESASNVQDIVLFSKPHHMSCLFKKLTPNASGYFWIAGDSWATSVEVLNTKWNNFWNNPCFRGQLSLRRVLR